MTVSTDLQRVGQIDAVTHLDSFIINQPHLCNVCSLCASTIVGPFRPASRLTLDELVSEL
jgi:hypothetical protein